MMNNINAKLTLNATKTFIVHYIIIAGVVKKQKEQGLLNQDIIVEQKEMMKLQQHSMEELILNLKEILTFLKMILKMKYLI